MIEGEKILKPQSLTIRESQCSKCSKKTQMSDQGSQTDFCFDIPPLNKSFEMP